MPVIGNILYCPDCKHPQPQINFIRCELCGHDLGAPNVNIVSSEDEICALQKRYTEAKDYLINNGLLDIHNKFEVYYNENIKALFNTSIDILNGWLVKTDGYKSYDRAVEEGIRPIAKLVDDQKRTAIDGFLYGRYGRDITFAALTLNTEGLNSYGNCRVILKEAAIANRSSVLEENSYTFVKTHNISLETPNFPLGYRSNWQNKFKLTIAKIYKSFKPNTLEQDFIGMILFDSANRETDEFIEVHIYKELTNLAVETIFIPAPKNIVDKISIKAIQQKCPGIVSEF